MNIRISTHDKWKCPDCGMTERKEPHNRLRDHMLEKHGKRWNESQNSYTAERALDAQTDFRADIERLRGALRKIAELDEDMGIYPAAVRGFHDERDYEQRDGYKNGWNAACMEFTQKAAEIANAALAPEQS